MSKKIVLTQFFTKNVSYGEFSKAINERYCANKGYTYHLESDSDKIRNGLEGRAPTWYKPKLILEVLEKHNPDYVLFLDADAVVYNEDYTIEGFIQEGVDIIVTEDHGPSKMNAGVLLVKNTPWAKDFLRQWWESGNVHPFYQNALWHDQTCFGFLLDSITDSKDHIKIISNSILNGRDQDEKCFIFHAFSFGLLKNRTIDTLYYKKFNIDVPIVQGKSLEEISIAHSTDKAYQHRYVQEVYEELFRPVQDTTKLFVEIGVYEGNSLRAWKKYFSNSKIIGLDKNPTTVNKGIEGCELIYCDQSNESLLKEIKSKILGADVIVDDGTHKMFDQQKTLAILFEALQPGGIYIVEDLHTSIECRNPAKQWCGWGDASKMTALETLENFSKTGKMKSDYLTENECKYLEENIEKVEVFKISEESITSVIRKKSTAAKVEFIHTMSTELSKPLVSEYQLVPQGTSSKNIGVVYLVFCVGDWQNIVREQLFKVKQSGLYDEAKSLWMVVNDLENNKDKIDAFIRMYPKFQLDYKTTNGAEAPGIRKVYEICKEDPTLKVLYFHAKGVSNTYKTTENREICQRKIQGSRSWRECMEFFLISGWRDCIKNLETHDLAVTTLTDTWVWGNFWWANGDFIARHPYPEDGSRWFYEYWITINVLDPAPKVYQYYHFNHLGLVSNLPSFCYDGSLPAGQKIELISATFGAMDIQMDEGYPQPPSDLLGKVVDITKYAQDNLALNNFEAFDSRLGSSFSIDPFPNGRKFLTINFKVMGNPVSLTWLGSNSDFKLYNRPDPVIVPEIKKLAEPIVLTKALPVLNKSGKKKIALISPMTSEVRNRPISATYKKCIRPFFLTAKKFFLPNSDNYDVDFLFITNSNETCDLDFVKTIRIEEESKGYSYGCLMKILCLEHVPNEYEYIFVADMDSIFAQEIKEEDLLGKPFVFLDHYYKPPLQSILETDTFIKIGADISKEFWTMDTFIGGKYDVMMDFNKFARKHHNIHLGEQGPRGGFYSYYPGEFFILKYVFETKIDHRRLSSCCEFGPGESGRQFHIGELPNNLDSKNGLGLEFLKHYKQLHQTKMKLEILDEVVKYVLGEPSTLVEWKEQKDKS